MPQETPGETYPKFNLVVEKNSLVREFGRHTLFCDEFGPGGSEFTTIPMKTPQIPAVFIPVPAGTFLATDTLAASNKSASDAARPFSSPELASFGTVAGTDKLPNRLQVVVSSEWLATRQS